MNSLSQTALNDNLTFDSLPDGVRQAFRGRVIAKRFEQNHLFYKMSREPDHTSFSISPWWSSYEPAINGDSGFVGSWNNPLGMRSATRINAAVPERWNTLDNLLLMRLRVPIVGFVGKCERQLAHLGANPLTTTKFGAPFLGGGHVQVFLPNLTINEIEWMMSASV